jgi:uncharacterized RDD family membrane protein YckC
VSEVGYPFASLARRVSAWLFDAALGLVLAVCFVKAAGGEHDVSTVWHLMAFKSVNGQTGHELSAAMNPTSPSLAVLRPLAGLLAILTVITAVMVAYRVVTTAKWGAGIGKRLLGLRVVVEHPTEPGAQVPGWGRSWKRWAVPLGPGLIPLPATGLLAYVPAFRDHRRRGLHDRAAGTVVVDVRVPLARAAALSPTLAAADEDFFVSRRAAGDGYGTMTVRSPGTSGERHADSTSRSGTVRAVIRSVPAPISSISEGNSAR